MRWLSESRYEFSYGDHREGGSFAADEGPDGGPWVGAAEHGPRLKHNEQTRLENVLKIRFLRYTFVYVTSSVVGFT